MRAGDVFGVTRKAIPRPGIGRRSLERPILARREVRDDERVDARLGEIARSVATTPAATSGLR